MSTRTAYVITCDHPGCDEEHLSAYSDVHMARRDADGNHWRRRRQGRQWKDLCPDHKDA